MEDRDQTLPGGPNHLRVALLLNSLDVPAWIHEMLGRIRQMDGVELVLAVMPRKEDLAPPPPPRGAGRLLKGLVKHRHELLFQLWARLDKRLYPVSKDAFAIVNAADLLKDCPTLLVKPLRKKWIDIIQDEDVDRIRATRPDVILRLGFRILRGKILDAAPYGVWSLHHGDHRVNRGGPPGVWEVIDRMPTTGSILQVISEELDGGMLLAHSLAPTDFSGSLARNRNHYYWKTSQFIPRALARLSQHDPTQFPPPNAQDYIPYSKPIYTTPRNLRVLGCLGRLAASKAVNMVRSFFFNEQWFIAYRKRTSPRDPNNVFHRFKLLTPPKDRFWADPCPVHHNGRYYLFMEEMPFSTRKGVIAASELRDDGSWSRPRVVLECPYHLSYPCVWRWKDTFYMVPESSLNRTIGLWRCREFPYEWEFDSFLMEGVQAADSTFFEHDGRLWMFACMASEGARALDELFAFHAPDIQGPWTPHACNPLVSDARFARPAGIPFLWNGKRMRPAQDCSGRYGHRVVIREILKLTPTEYEERDVSAVEPTWARGVFATHTLNIADDLTVIDGCRLRPRLG